MNCNDLLDRGSIRTKELRQGLKLLGISNNYRDISLNKSADISVIYFLGSDRSPRRGNLVCAFVRPSLSSNNEF